MASRPEHQAPPEVFYNEEEAQKYTTNTRIIEIQTQMSDRALELLSLDPENPHLLLDIGCGSGLSGEILSDAGNVWVGVDISSSMLAIAKDREIDGDLVLNDMGQGIPFRPGMFDGAISISALQWLCNADKTNHNPRKRLHIFFESLFASLMRGSRAVFQFYPEGPEQVEMITSSAIRCGFTGGLLVDYPNSTKAKKYFLVLFAGVSNCVMPKALGEEDTDRNYVAYGSRQTNKHREKRVRAPVKGRDWILQKKERQRQQGKKVRPDSKYTGRKRGPKF